MSGPEAIHPLTPGPGPALNTPANAIGTSNGLAGPVAAETEENTHVGAARTSADVEIGSITPPVPRVSVVSITD